MIDHTCILTIGDFTTLKALQEQWSARDHDLAPALRQKLNSARVVFQNDLPRAVATLGSQISYAIDGEGVRTHTLTSATGVDARWLPISIPLGLALLGQREGTEMIVPSGREGPRRVKLHRVLDQPEASWPTRFNSDPVGGGAPKLQLVPSSRSPFLEADAVSDGDDDPGPAAA